MTTGDGALRLAPFVSMTEAGDVEIAVVLAGICRTDLHAAAGRIRTASGRVLGHELAGRVTGVGAKVTRFRPGERVTVFPIVGCARCPSCGRGAPPWRCERSVMLGIDRQGAFADRLVVPQRAVYRLPDSVSFAHGAYAEPVAASLAVLDAELKEGAKGVILGAGRIAELTRRVLASRGIDAPIRDPERDVLASCSVDFVIETAPTEHAIDAALDALRPGGVLVLKSRPADKVPFDFRRAVAREITIRAVAYGDMAAALTMIASGSLGLDDFVGPSYPLADYEAAFAAARVDESKKIFLRPEGVA